jgi:subtilisin family serine protease
MRSRIAALAGALVVLAVPSSAHAAGDPLRGEQYGLDIVEADAARAVSTGEGAVVAVVDSGVRADHQDLQGRLLTGYDFVDDDADPNVPASADGHGTHVLGIAAANAGNGVGIAGVAPGARYLPVRVLGDDGSGTTDDVAAGIDYAVREGAHVINLSLGEQLGVLGGSSKVNAAIDRALDAGRVVVAAAGNTGVPACEQPSGQGRLLCVGSVDENRQRSFFSSFGFGLGLTAPGGSALFGNDIVSTFNESASSYTQLAGTSQAAPHVAGVAALLVSKGLRGQAVVQRLLATATDAGTPGPDAEYGAGIVNARRAVEGLGSAGGGGGGQTPGSQPGSGTGSAALVSLRRTSTIRRVLRRGIRVRVRAAGRGRASVGARRAGRRVARGSRRVAAGRSRIVVARVNRPGRRILRRAQRRDRRIALRVAVRVPGAPLQRRKISLRP